MVSVIIDAERINRPTARKYSTPCPHADRDIDSAVVIDAVITLALALAGRSISGTRIVMQS